MKNLNVSIKQLEADYTLNGVELTGPEWNNFVRLAGKCGVEITVTQADDGSFVFNVEKK